MQVETVFPASDGTPMPAVLTVPDGADGPVPGVLMKVYPEAGHSFFTRTPALKGRVVRRLPIHAAYHEASAQDAHRRVVAFFEEHLAAS